MILRKKVLIFMAVLVLTAISLSLFSCADKNILRFKNDGDTGNLIDETNGRYYIYCKGYLRASKINQNVYAICPKEKGVSEVKLYEIDGIDPAKWLSENIKMGIAFLFREQSEEEPKLSEFETEIIHITATGEITLRIGLINSKEEIETIVNDYVNGKQTPIPDYVSDDFTFNFESAKYKGIFYVLQYLIDDKGETYLYDRWTGRCVLCNYKPFDNAETETENKIEEKSDREG